MATEYGGVVGAFKVIPSPMGYDRGRKGFGTGRNPTNVLEALCDLISGSRSQCSSPFDGSLSVTAASSSCPRAFVHAVPSPLVASVLTCHSFSSFQSQLK